MRRIYLAIAGIAMLSTTTHDIASAQTGPKDWVPQKFCGTKFWTPPHTRLTKHAGVDFTAGEFETGSFLLNVSCGDYVELGMQRELVGYREHKVKIRGRTAWAFEGLYKFPQPRRLLGIRFELPYKIVLNGRTAFPRHKIIFSVTSPNAADTQLVQRIYQSIYISL